MLEEFIRFSFDIISVESIFYKLVRYVLDYKVEVRVSEKSAKIKL